MYDKQAMVMRKTNMVILVLSAFFVFHVSMGAERTIVDSFDAGLENWGKPLNSYFQIKNGMLVNDTPYVSAIGLKDKSIGAFSLSFKLKFLPGAEKLAGHFSIGIDRGHGSWKLYFTRNDKQSLIRNHFLKKDREKGGKRPFDETISLDLPSDEWMMVTLTAREGRFEMKINDKCFVLGAAPGFGGIGFSCYRQPVAIDDLKLTYSEPEPLSHNLQINGSFEHATNPDIPDYWGGTGTRYRTNGLPGNICTAAGLAEFRDKFFLDETQARFGKKSIRVEYPFHLLGKAIGLEAKQDYTVSCYIKSDEDNRRIQIGATPADIGKPSTCKTIMANREWRRYEFILRDYPHGTLSFFVCPLDTGKVWIDGIQVEKGRSATPFTPCWYDSGFDLPADVNRNQCSGNTNGIEGTLARHDLVALEKLTVSSLALHPVDPATHTFNLLFDLRNCTEKEKKLTVVACVTAKDGREQVKTALANVGQEKDARLELGSFCVDDLRCTVNISLIDESGKTVKQHREFVDVPQSLRIYPEFSFYTTEKDARIVADFGVDGKELKDKILELTTIVSGYPSYPCLKKSYRLSPMRRRQLFSIPISRLNAGQDYTVKARVIDQHGKTVMSADAALQKYTPHLVEVKINRINRGIYVNGEPFIPYGVLASGFGLEQLRYYHKCGFSYLCFMSSWQSIEENLEFLANCAKEKVKAIAFHLARPHGLSPAQAVKYYKKSPALIGVIPNDESSDRIVYKKVQEAKLAYPEIISCGNQHFHSYRAFAERIEGFPGDVLSIDRYPFILQPPGRPQMTNDIYSFELCLEMMDRDGKRERKPVFCWLQAAERFAKEPTPRQLTWQTYIALVNHCMGFTYFGGLPQSRFCWRRMRELNRELRQLKPYLFSLDEEPEINVRNTLARESVRHLAKRLDDRIIIIAVSRSFYPIDAAFDLSCVEVSSGKAVVMFENRKLELKDNTLADRFSPFARHVYEIRIKGEK